MEYVVGGKQVDLTRALPITLGDLVVMEAKGFRQDTKEPLKALVAFVVYAVQKANPAVTEEEVRALGPLEPVVVEISRWLREGAPNPPAASS